jgi:hypothetical protein
LSLGTEKAGRAAGVDGVEIDPGLRELAGLWAGLADDARRAVLAVARLSAGAGKRERKKAKR